jgi:hypothetical protein
VAPPSWKFAKCNGGALRSSFGEDQLGVKDISDPETVDGERKRRDQPYGCELTEAREPNTWVRRSPLPATKGAAFGSG